MKKNIILARNIFRNWLSYFVGSPSPVPVGYLIISTTYACNARCLMCNIHEFYLKQPDLQEKEIDFSLLFDRLQHADVLKSIRHIDLTGGEPFLKKDLQQFISGLFTLPAVDFVSINTNGILTRKIVDDVESILKTLKSQQRFSLSVSIDGVGPLHDTIRGVPGAFEKIETTIGELRILCERYPQFSLRSNAVVQRANIHGLDQIKEFWRKHGIAGGFGVIQTPFYTRSSNLNSYNDIREFNVQELAIIKSVSPKSRGMNHYIDKGCQRPLHCFAGYSALCIDPFGVVYPCNFLTGNEEYRIGDLKNKGLDEIWSSSQSRMVRKMTKKCPYTQCWNGCEVDQTLIQYDLIDRVIRILTGGMLSYYRLKGLRDLK